LTRCPDRAVQLGRAKPKRGNDSLDHVLAVATVMAMKQTFRFGRSATVALLAVLLASCTPNPDNTTLARVGQPAPGFELTTVDGERVSLRDLQGKVVLVNFFATWCPPCLQEMPHLERSVWQQFKEKNFVVIGIGREHTNQELLPFHKEQHLTFPIAGDADGEVFGRYAEEFIPRNFLIGADGRIAYQSVGFSPDDFAHLVDAVRKELARSAAL
jgi:peroxiredoxin